MIKIKQNIINRQQITSQEAYFIMNQSRFILPDSIILHRVGMTKKSRRLELTLISNKAQMIQLLDERKKN